MGTRCTLRIRMPTFSLDLEGDAALVRSGYEGMREELLRQLEAGGAGSDEVDPTVRVVPPEARAGRAREGESPEYIWVFRSNDLYHKVHVIERARLWATGLGPYVLPGCLKRIYVESEHASLLERLVPAGETLWSELTKLGRERLRAG